LNVVKAAPVAFDRDRTLERVRTLFPALGQYVHGRPIRYPDISS
jgi:hypothetical protein